MQIWNNISKLTLLFVLLGACTSDHEVEWDEKEAINEELSNQGDQEQRNAWSLDKRTIKGKAQGTTYIVKTSDDSLYITPDELSTFFEEFDNELSTYKSSSLIARFNDGMLNEFDLDSTKYFKTSYQLSAQVSQNTDGAFDPTVFPLVKVWGFFQNPQESPDQHQIDSVMSLVGFGDQSLMIVENGTLKKKEERVMLDFNAIAQGQSADEIAAILNERGQENFFIEVGGEISTKGINDRDTKWVIGIDEPKESNTGISGKRELENYLSISNRAVATSGSYRKFYEKNGEKYSHTINPRTGRPVQHNLLSVTVVGENAATCDAYATAFMTMGVDPTLDFIESRDSLDLEVYMLFENKTGRIERAYSNGMEKYFLKSSE